MLRRSDVLSRGAVRESSIRTEMQPPLSIGKSCGFKKLTTTSGMPAGSRVQLAYVSND